MAEIRIERKRGPSIWPWVIGLIVLALLIWAIAELVNTDRDNKTMAVADSAGVPEANAAAPGAMAPSTPGAQPAPAPGTVAPATEQPGVGDLGALLPLGVQDVGQTVSTGGTVLSQPAHGGFWLKSDANPVIWVESNLKVKPGQQVPQLTGTLEAARADEAAQWLKDTDVPAQGTKHPDWQFLTQLYLATGSAAAGAGPDSTASHAGARRPAGPTRVARRR